MTDAYKILKMIENASPYDTATLDEIDARVWCYLNNVYLVRFDFHGTNREINFGDSKTGTFKGEAKDVPLYTRSRDALKRIRPDGVVIQVTYYPQGFQGDAVGSKGKSPRLPTEELAELHAIIQAIVYERGFVSSVSIVVSDQPTVIEMQSKKRLQKTHDHAKQLHERKRNQTLSFPHVLSWLHTAHHDACIGHQTSFRTNHETTVY